MKLPTKLYKVFDKPPFFFRAGTWLKKSDQPIKSGPNSRNAIIVPILQGQYASMKTKVQSFKRYSDIMKSMMKNMVLIPRSLKTNPHIGKRTIDEATVNELEAYAKSLGVCQIGYTKLNPNHIFKGFEVLSENAIVLAMEMDRELIKTSPSIEFLGEIYRTYDDLGLAAKKVAAWLREKGYDCHPSPALGGDVNTVPVGEDAGMGCIGKNGILVTPEFGPCVRLTTVFVKIDNLPFSEKNEHMWIRDFCETCNRCITKCPAAAIHQDPETLEDGTPRFIKPEQCVVPFSKGCSDCIKNCVFTHGDYNKIKTNYLKNQEQMI